MIKQSILTTVFLLLGLLVSQRSVGNQVAGVDITYQCVGQDSFLIKVNVFRDCDGINWNATTITVDLNSPCSGSDTAILATTNVIQGGNPVPIEVSQLCPSAISSCNGGSYPGMELYTYEGIAVLNPPCNSWEIGYSPPCCRNNAILNASSTSAYTFATINNVADSCNNSPEFNVNNPIPYSCVGQQVCYDYGVTEPDGDSLVYSLDTAYQSAGTPAAYNNPYTATHPIQGSQLLTIDPASGKLQFIPGQAGSFVVVIRVCEYDRQTGALLGCVRRDMQFVVDNCTNQAPSLCYLNTISVFTGAGTVNMSPGNIEMCAGENYSFSFMVSDPDVSDSLKVTSNLSQVLPGSSINLNHSPGGNPVTVNVTLTTAATVSEINRFYIQVSDDACPVEASNSIPFKVKVLQSVVTNADRGICLGQSTQLNAFGSTSNYTWSVLQGDTTSLGCTNCPDPLVTPNVSTMYAVTGNANPACKNTDTVQVITGGNFTLNITDDTVVCSNSNVQLNTTPDLSAPAYSYQWSNGHLLNSDTIANPAAMGLNDSAIFDVTVTSDSGCVKTAGVNVDVEHFPTGFSITASDTDICGQDTVNLEVKLNGPTTNCGPANNSCFWQDSTFILGSGNDSTSMFNSLGNPNPFLGSENSVRSQFLIRSSDLSAQGVGQGQIKKVGFEVANTNGATTYENFILKIGCTNSSSLNIWEPGLSNVVNPTVVTLSNGWNMVELDTPYDYDGTSNLVIEVCFANQTSYNFNPSIHYSNRPYYASLLTFPGSGSACGFSGLIQPPFQKLPNMRFTMCTQPKLEDFALNWINAQGLLPGFQPHDSTIQVHVDSTSPSAYSLLISDSTGTCTKAFSQQISVRQKQQILPKPDTLCPTSGVTAMDFINNSGSGFVGFWSGNGIVDQTQGLFNPVVAGIGQHQVNYNLYPGECALPGSTTVMVKKPPDVSLSTLGPYCELDSNVVLNGVNTGVVSGATAIDDLAVVDTTGTLDFSRLPQGLGSANIKWTVTGQYCVNDTVYTIPLNPQFNATIKSPGVFCPGDTAVVRLVNTDSTSTAPSFRGHWSGSGIIDTKLGWFDPAVLSAGGQVKVVLDSSGICGDRDSTLIVMDTTPKISFSFPLGDTGPFCIGANQVVDLEGHPVHGPGQTGVGTWDHLNDWMPDSLNEFNLADYPADTGTYQSVYAFKTVNGCRNRDTVELVFIPNPPMPTVTHDQSSGKITATLWDGDYEWFRDGNLLGQYPLTATSITGTQPGHYHVEVTNQCSTGHSDSVYIKPVSIGGILGNNGFTVYPNPVNGNRVVIAFEHKVQITNIELKDATGKRVPGNWVQRGNRAILDIEQLTSGMYFLTIETAESNTVTRLMVIPD